MRGVLQMLPCLVDNPLPVWPLHLHNLSCTCCSYKLQKRLATDSWSNTVVWVDLVSKPTCADGECFFDISSLTDGLYKVEVAGRMLYGSDEAVGTAAKSTDTGDHSVSGTLHMRSGIIGVGDPGRQGRGAWPSLRVLRCSQSTTKPGSFGSRLCVHHMLTCMGVAQLAHLSQFLMRCSSCSSTASDTDRRRQQHYHRGHRLTRQWCVCYNDAQHGVYCTSSVFVLTWMAGITAPLHHAALKYQWVYFKDADTATGNTNGLTPLSIPFASVDPLTKLEAQSYQVCCPTPAVTGPLLQTLLHRAA